MHRDESVNMDDGVGRQLVVVTIYQPIVCPLTLYLVGKSVSVNVNKLTAHTCGQRLKPALSLALNQSEDSPYPLPINSFHYSRVNESVNLSVLGSNCYRWLIQFEEPLEIAFLLIDFSLRKESDEVEKPNVTVDVPHRYNF